MCHSPCTGSSYTCKPYTTQITEIMSMLSENSIQIGTLWIDLEQDNKYCTNVSFAAINLTVPTLYHQWYSGTMVPLETLHRHRTSLPRPGHLATHSVSTQVQEVSCSGLLLTIRAKHELFHRMEQLIWLLLAGHWFVSTVVVCNLR
jgi:hypothetical protein